MPTPPYATLVQKDATNQKLYLAIVDSTGAEQPQYGKVEMKLGDIRDILAATTPTPLVDIADINTVKFREVKLCDDSGSTYYAIVPITGGYTKP